MDVSQHEKVSQLCQYIRKTMWKMPWNEADLFFNEGSV